MFRRLFWFAAGLSTGVWATYKVNRAMRRLTPEGLAATAADRATELGARAKAFALDVRTGMTEREAELGRALGIEPPAAPRSAPAPAPLTGRRRHQIAPGQSYKQAPPSSSSSYSSYKKKEGH